MVDEQVSSRDGPLLLVEDDEVDVLTVRRALSRLGSSRDLRVVGDGEQALEELRTGPIAPCLVLLDLNMPRMSGLELLRAARAEGLAVGVPVVVLTSSRRDQDILEGFELGVAAYLSKPVSAHKLGEVLGSLGQHH
ncbi:MAG: response regulator [Holophagales bacterium]|nr:response regulator [Holophagales bacterium]